MADTTNCKLNRGDDHISCLPDEILLTILSKLDLKEQARTCVLSSRWTHLWTFTSCLNINAEDFVEREADNRTKTLKFISTTDRILTMHRGQAIDQLIITFPIDPCDKFSDHLKVDGWIRVAIKKQVRALHLNYSSDHALQICSLGSATFSSLTTLTLEKTFIADHVIHGLLSSSPSLLELSIVNCYGVLLGSKISGSSLKLKHLKLVGTFVVNSLEISAPNLESFAFSNQGDTTWPAQICFKNIPLLTRLTCSLAFMLYDWRNFYALLPQLITLKLNFSENSVIRDICDFPELTNLKQMHVRLLSNDANGGWLSLLFKASPYLCRLSFDLGAYKPKQNLIKTFPDHEFLEELEIHNFKGFEYEVQLLTSIASSCSSLQKIILHPRSNETTVEQEYLESVVKKVAAKKELDIVFRAPNTNNF